MMHFLAIALLLLPADPGVRPGGPRIQDDGPTAVAEQEPDELFAPVRLEYDAAFRDWFRARKAAADAGTEFTLPHPAVEFWSRGLEHARAGSAMAGLWCLQFAAASGLEGAAAVEVKRELYTRSVRMHHAEPSIETVMNMLRREYTQEGIGRAAAAALLRELSQAVEDPEMKAKALYMEAYVLGHKNDDELDVALAVATYGEVVERFPDSEQAVKAKGKIFSHERLRVGLTAPDFTATDTAGESFSLSDYRGRVVVLSFWGFWCAPCVRMLPHERDLVLRLADQPFAFLGVNTDEDPDFFARRATESGVVWRNAWDGSTKGPLSSTWGISSFPSIFVLDANGVIRFIGVRGEELDQAVSTLLDEAQGASTERAEIERESPAELEAAFARLDAAFRRHAQSLRGARGPSAEGSLAVADAFPKFLDLAQRGSVPAWSWLLSHVDEAGFESEELVAAKREIFGTLFTEYADEPLVLPALARLRESHRELGLETAGELFELLAQRSTLTENQARARFVHARLLEATSGAPEQRERARALYEEVVKLGDTTVAVRARTRADCLARIVVGKAVPALEGVDVAGATLTLAEHRGQVVVVSFWSLHGRRAADHIRADRHLVETLKEAPFVLIGVNNDRNQRDFARRAEKQGVLWRTILDGPGGPLAGAWGVQRPPMRFVVDAEGILRHIDLTGGALDEVLAPLLERTRDQLGR